MQGPGSNFQFHEEDEFSGMQNRIQGYGGITGFIIKNSGGLLENPKQANIFMLVVVVLCVFLAIVLKPEGEDLEQTGELTAPTGKTIEYPTGGGAPRIVN